MRIACRRPRPGGRLFRHDLRVLRNGFADAFATTRDRVLLAIVTAVGAALLADAARSQAPPPDWRLAMGALLLFGAGVQAGLGQALDDFVQDSPLAADALEEATRRRYLATWHLIALAAAGVVVLLLMPSRLPLLLPAYAGGTVAAVCWRALPRPRRIMRHAPPMARVARPGGTWRALARAVATRQMSLRGSVAARAFVVILVGAGTAATAAFARNTAGVPPVQTVLFVAVIGTVLLLSRVDHAVVRFAAFAGHRAAGSVAAHATALATAGVALVVVALPVGGARPAAAAALIVAAGLFVLMLRVLAYRLYAKRSADLLLAFIFVGIGSVLSTAPFLVPPLILGVAVVLGTRARATTWLSP